jgi:PAS domain S-box-containing protein
MIKVADLPLRIKVLSMIVGISSIGVLAGAVLMLLGQQSSARATLADTAVARAATLAKYAVGPLVFEDAEGAREILGQLKLDPLVTEAALFDEKQAIFAQFPDALSRRPRLPHGTQAFSGFVADQLVTYQPVVLDGRTVGVLYLATSTRSLEPRMWRSTLVAAGICLLVIFACGLLGARLQRFITDPVHKLATAMHDIREGGDLTLRVQHPARDELGALFVGFNAMLDEIQARGHERDRTAQRLSSMLEASPDLFLVLDQDGRYVEVLTRKHELLPSDAHALVGKLVDEHLSLAAARELRGSIRIALDQGLRVQVEYEMQVAGIQHWLEAVIAPLSASRTGGGGLVLMASRDVSRRRELETLLRHAQKMEAVGQLAGGVAHDFNNLLGGIIGYTELLKQRGEAEGVKEISDRILDAADRAADLVANLLAFSRRGKRESKPTDLHELIARVVNILERTVDRRIQIVQQFTAAACRTNGDASQLESALLNLGLNGRDAMPEGGSLTFHTRLLPREGGMPWVEISVTDTGVGIPEGVIEHIFEPFFTTKEPGKGTGLGLAAVYGTLESHGGSVEVDSKPGVGTTFRLLLESCDALPAVAALEEDPVLRGTGHILVVDDEAALRDVVSCLLGELGYRVTTCNNGREAVEFHRLHSDSVDLTIVDQMMPELSGVDAIAQIRKLNPTARLLLASGNPPSEDSSLADGFLQKPLRFDQLSTKVAEVMARAGRPPRELKPATEVSEVS